MHLFNDHNKTKTNPIDTVIIIHAPSPDVALVFNAQVFTARLLHIARYILWQFCPFVCPVELICCVETMIGHSSNPFVFLGVQNLQQTQIIG